MNWHPNPKGHRYDSDVLAYYILTSVINYIKTNNDIINKSVINDNNNLIKLDNWLIKESGNWQNLVYKKATGYSITEPGMPITPADDSEWPDPIECLPTCKFLPFTLTTWRPLFWNVGHRFVAYLLYLGACIG